MTHQRYDYLKMSGAAIRGRLRRVFVGREREVETAAPKVFSPVRPGRGMPASREASDGIGRSSKSSGASAIWVQYGVDAEGAAGVFVVGSHDSSGRMRSLARDFSLRGLSVDFCNDFEESLKSIAISPQRWKLLVVDVDHVERALDIEDIVNDLVLFREQCINIAVVLLSHSFARDDSDLIRSAIADYSFRASVKTEMIYAALPEVFANNRSWVMRREALKKSDRAIVPFPGSEGA